MQFTSANTGSYSSWMSLQSENEHSQAETVCSQSETNWLFGVPLQ